MPHTPGPPLSFFKCPSAGLRFSKKDKPTLHLISFRDEENLVEGEIGVTMGKDAEYYARLFAAAPRMLQELKLIYEFDSLIPAYRYRLGKLIAAAEGKEGGSQ